MNIDELKNLYDKAVEYVDKNASRNLVFVPAISGEKYFSQPENKRIMVVGRSANGWSMPKYSQADCDGKWFPYGLRWVYESGNFCADGSGHKPSVNHSKFWQFISYKLVYEGFDKADFADYIVWSNLYKISPADGGNPNNKLCKATYDLMDKILCEELKFYRPEKVWFITEPYNKVFGDWMFWKYEKGTTFENACNYINENNIEAKLFLRPERRRFEDVIKKAAWNK